MSLKISQLTNGNPAQSGDLFPIDRSGANFSLSVGSIAASSLSNGVIGSGNIVLATAPTLVTPVIGVATGTSLALTNVISSATPATNRTVDSEPSLTAASVAVPPGGSIAAVRGNLTVNAGTTVTAGYLYGVQGKLTFKGTLNESLGEYNAALVGQLDFSAVTAITAVNGLSMLWLDAGASATAGSLAKVNAINITNSIASNPLHAIIGVPEADAVYFLDANDTADSHWIVTAAVGGSQTTKIKVHLNGTDYFIPCYTA